MNFPLMSDLPMVVNTQAWKWHCHQATPLKKFWCGEDPEGRQWITKLRGSDFAYREIVFARLAQAMGWSCQSSVFIELDDESKAKLNPENGEFHSAHFFLDEHTSDSCDDECDPSLWLPGERIVEQILERDKIANLIDWPKAELAAYLFGATEPSDKLFTSSHEYVMIDNELMFAEMPSSFETSEWLQTPAGEGLACQICQEFSSLSDDEVKKALSYPHFLSVSTRDKIELILMKSREFAEVF